MSKRKAGRGEGLGVRQDKAPTRRAPLGVMLAIAGVAVVLVGAIAFVSLRGSGPAGASGPGSASSADDVATKGAGDAQVTIVEYSDFQCPYCGQFAQTSGRQIDDQYVRTGKVRFSYRNRAFLGPESNWAAEAAFCAGDQGQFWAYHDKLFASQAGENKGAFSKDRLKGFAAQLGLDASAFGSCLDKGTYASRVRDETSESSRRGVTGTPTFFIGNSRVDGNRPYEIFRAAIETELRRVQ